MRTMFMLNKHTRVQILGFFLITLVLLANTGGVIAEDKPVNTQDNPAISTSGEGEPGKGILMTVKRVFTHDGRVNDQVEAGIGDRIRVEIDRLADAISDNQIAPHKLVLYLDELELKGLYAISMDAPHGTLEFKLERNDPSRQAWNILLGSPLSAMRRNTRISVGPEGGQAIPPFDSRFPPTFTLRVFDRGWFYFSSIAFLLLLALFVWRAKEGNIIRDSNPPQPPPGKKKPYSLARLQMAFWFFLVIGSFIFIYLITGDYNTLTEQALILIGIGSGTALGAAAIDSNKRSSADTELYALRPERGKLEAEVAELTSRQSSLKLKPSPAPEDKQALSDVGIELAKKSEALAQLNKKIEDASAGLTRPVSEGLFRDLLTDANGTSFHRFQMLVWTIVLGFLFCVGVYKSLAMPEFSTTLLALMGISAGTYLGFKIPERQA